MNLKVTYSKPPETEFVALMMELGVLQFAASAKLGNQTIKKSEIMNFKTFNVVDPFICG